MQVAFEGAGERLKQAADRQKRVHDQHVRDVPLQEGQLVYLRDLSARGRQKIRDRWSSVRYRVLRMPKEGGAVYTIVPVDDETKVRWVHCTMLKAVVGVDSPGHAPSHNSSLREEPPPAEEPSFEYDLLFLDQTYVATSAMPSTRSAMSQVPSSAATSGALTSPALPSVAHPGSSNMGPRRTAHQTAGQHSEMLTLLILLLLSNSVSVWFRPWS